MSRSRPSFQHCQKSQSRAWGISSTTWRTQLLSKKTCGDLEVWLTKTSRSYRVSKAKGKDQQHVLKEEVDIEEVRVSKMVGLGQQGTRRVWKPTAVEYHLIRSVAGWHLLHQISCLSILQYLNKSGIPSHIGQDWNTLIPPCLVLHRICTCFNDTHVG